MHLGELGVPRSIAMRLTFPESVTRFNITKLRATILKGTDEVGGALYIERKQDGKRFDLHFYPLQKAADGLQHGDIVERMMINGDIVIFNRQVSFQKRQLRAMVF